MAPQREFIDRRDPKQQGRRSTDSFSGAPAFPGALNFDTTAEEAYWRDHYAAEPYYNPGYNFEDYLPAYRVGWEARRKSSHSRFEDLERELEAEFHWNRGQSRLLWDQARHAARAAFERVR